LNVRNSVKLKHVVASSSLNV